jgi:hypothetical protein
VSILIFKVNPKKAHTSTFNNNQTDGKLQEGDNDALTQRWPCPKQNKNTGACRRRVRVREGCKSGSKKERGDGRRLGVLRRYAQVEWNETRV